MAASPDAPSRLSRQLGTFDAVVVGLGAMVGAGVFSALGPAARAAGPGLLVGLAIAAVVAYCNATSAAQLAAIYPESGGTYVYGSKRLGPVWGFLAGWGFVAGKIASCAAMALTFAHHVAPAVARPVATAAVLALTAVNYLGIQKTARLTRVLVVLVLAALAVFVVAAAGGGHAALLNLQPLAGTGGARGLLEAAGILFFAFAGYARITTLGEEVTDPARTIPRAIPIALGIALAVYATVALSALLAAGAPALAASPAPLATAVELGRFAWLAPVVRAGAAIASLGVLLSLLAGVSRTVFSMASQGDLPRWLAAVHEKNRVPHHAEIAIGLTVAGLVWVTDLRGAIAFSSFAVLAYYGVANASALTLARGERRWPRALAALGLGGCALLAFSLPRGAVGAGAGLFAAGGAVWLGRRLLRARPES